MIRYLRVEGLNNKLSRPFEFHEDLNIFTGPNGSCKTTLLKLIWYLISGHLEKILPEIPFKFIAIETDMFSLKITQDRSDKVSLDWKYSEEVLSETYDKAQVKEIFVQLNKKIAPAMKSSLFFPTFRRIEGGFSGVSDFTDIDSRRYSRRQLKSSQFWFHDLLQDESIDFSDIESYDNHKFIAAISTDDIDRLVKDIHSNISGEANKRHRKISDEIVQEIRDYFDKGKETDTQDLQDLQEAKDLLDEIRKELENVDKERVKLFQPISVLSDYVGDFYNFGIRITENIILGHYNETISNAISSDKLSSGEKQMLSFLCYNAFYKNMAVFIDEPELSLNVDWQRRLFPTLLEQGQKNQFFVATHSPFIYSKYPDKEFLLGEGNGDN